MTRQEAKELLQRPARIESRLRRKTQELETLRASLIPGAVRYDADKVQTTPGDRLADAMAELVELEEEIAQLQIEKGLAVLRIGKVLDQIEDKHAEILLAFYACRKPAKEIAERLHYSISYIYELIGDGLSMIADKVP